VCSSSSLTAPQHAHRGGHAEERRRRIARRPWTSTRRRPPVGIGSSRRSWRTCPSPSSSPRSTTPWRPGSRAAGAAPGLRPRRRNPPPRAGGRRGARRAERSVKTSTAHRQDGPPAEGVRGDYDLMRCGWCGLRQGLHTRWAWSSPLEANPGRFKDYIASEGQRPTSPPHTVIPIRRRSRCRSDGEITTLRSTAWPPLALQGGLAAGVSTSATAGCASS